MHISIGQVVGLGFKCCLQDGPFQWEWSNIMDVFGWEANLIGQTGVFRHRADSVGVGSGKDQLLWVGSALLVSTPIHSG